MTDLEIATWARLIEQTPIPELHPITTRAREEIALTEQEREWARTSPERRFWPPLSSYDAVKAKVVR